MRWIVALLAAGCGATADHREPAKTPTRIQADRIEPAGIQPLRLLVVTEVVRGGPAERLLEVCDVIAGANGLPIHEESQPRLTDVVESANGAPIALKIQR